MARTLILLITCLFSSVSSAAEHADTAWVRLYSSPGNYRDGASDIAVDKTGNVYVCGGISNAGLRTAGLIKYYPNGDTAWVRTYGRTGGDCQVNAMTLDKYSNVVTTGYAGLTVNSRDFLTLKYYPNGDTAWVRLYDGIEHGRDEGAGIAVDSSGNVYVTGTSQGVGTSCDYATIKYYPNGDTAWVRRYNGTGSSNSIVMSIAVDKAGSVYVTGDTGTSEFAADFGDYLTVKYYPNGDTAWVRTYNGPGNGDDIALSIAIDDIDNVYVTGWSSGVSTGEDFATIKYYPNGDTAWVRRYNGPGNGDDLPSRVTVDKSYNVLVTGHTDYDAATIKYYPNGQTAWVRTYSSPGSHWDQGNDLAADDLGNVYVTGTLYVGETQASYCTIKYRSNGDLGWVSTYKGTGNDGDVAVAIALDSKGSVYVTGESYEAGTGYDWATIMYLQDTANDVVQIAVSELPSAYEVSQNYPNPFNAVTQISYDVPTAARVTLEIFNITGQKVITLVNGEQVAGSYTVEWNGADQSGGEVASGVYIYRLKAGNFQSERKMVLLK